MPDGHEIHVPPFAPTEQQELPFRGSDGGLVRIPATATVVARVAPRGAHAWTIEIAHFPSTQPEKITASYFWALLRKAKHQLT